jgi:GNAT superfamily N-acetyltransferase
MVAWGKLGIDKSTRHRTSAATGQAVQPDLRTLRLGGCIRSSVQLLVAASLPGSLSTEKIGLEMPASLSATRRGWAAVAYARRMSSSPVFPPVSIRPATVDDLPVILDFIGQLARYEKLEHLCTVSEADLRAHLFGARPVAEVRLAERDGQPVGYALFFPNFSTFLGRPGLYLEDLYVREDLRGQGIGRALLRHLAQIAIERGWGRMEWAVLDWNTSAIRFYEERGASVMPDWRVCRATGSALENLAAGR